MGVIWVLNIVIWKKSRSKVFNVFFEHLNVELAGTSFLVQICFMQIYSCKFFIFACIYRSFLQSYDISWIMKGLNFSLRIYKRISQCFHLMHNVTNQIEVNSFQKSNDLLSVAFLLVSCRLVIKSNWWKVP